MKSTLTCLLILLVASGCGRQVNEDSNGQNTRAAALQPATADSDEESGSGGVSASSRVQKQLQGTWNVVESQADGKPIEDATTSHVVFSDANMTIAEKDRAIQGEYTLDVFKEPYALTLSPQTGGKLEAIFSLDGDDLVICFSLLPGAPAATEMTTEEGDGRLLVTLRRAETQGK